MEQQGLLVERRQRGPTAVVQASEHRGRTMQIAEERSHRQAVLQGHPVLAVSLQQLASQELAQKGEVPEEEAFPPLKDQSHVDPGVQNPGEAAPGRGPRAAETERKKVCKGTVSTFSSPFAPSPASRRRRSPPPVCSILPIAYSLLVPALLGRRALRSGAPVGHPVRWVRVA